MNGLKIKKYSVCNVKFSVKISPNKRQKNRKLFQNVYKSFEVRSFRKSKTETNELQSCKNNSIQNNQPLEENVKIEQHQTIQNYPKNNNQMQNEPDYEVQTPKKPPFYENISTIQNDLYSTIKLRTQKTQTNFLLDEVLAELSNRENVKYEVTTKINNENDNFFTRSTLTRKTFPVPKCLEKTYESFHLNEKSFQKNKSISLIQIDDALYDDKSNKNKRTDKINAVLNRSNDNNVMEWYKLDEDEKIVQLFKLNELQRVEKAKLEEASKNLRKIVHERRKKPSFEELETQSILLLSEIKYKIILQKIEETIKNTNINYSLNQITSRADNPADLMVSNLFIPLKNPEKKRKNEFFICVAICDTIVMATSIISPENDTLNFEENLLFQEVMSNFEITLKIYSLTYKKPSKLTLLKNLIKLNAPKAQNLKIDSNYNENLNALQSSFKLCGDAKITQKNINKENSSKINNFPNSRLSDTGNFKLFVSKIHIPNKLSGFLNLASEPKKCFTWNRKWCVLDQTKLKIFDCPSEENFKCPSVSLDLRYVLLKQTKVVDRSNCPKPRTFLLEIGRPSTVDDAKNGCQTVSTRPNFVVSKHFFSADNLKDLNTWLGEVNSVLKTLIMWKNLIFFDS